ncbi:MAG: hypothetical protein ACI4LI_09755 [Candidatus Fimenecus sp.]
MTDEERMKEYIRLCDEAHSNLEAPLTGGVITAPICKSCKHSDFHTDPWKPMCAVYGDLPLKYRRADSFDCPQYKILPNCPKSFLPLHIQRQMEQENK